jgi:RimJ/RimL family protein N-acetyltransferase
MGVILLNNLNHTHYTELAELANDIEIWKNVRDLFPHPYSVNDAQYFIDNIVSKPNNFIKGIFYDKSLAGVIGIHPQSDIYRKSGELGYWIGQSFWNKGIATEAVRLATKEAFNSLNIVRIHAGVFDFNVASQKVLLKNGFEYEGRAKKAVFKNKAYCDELRYGLVR